jgi:anthranilate phosphoribosyltransferase
MTDDLRLLRHVVYETAGRYHLAHGEFFTSLVEDSNLDIIKAALKAHKAGALYNVALQKLISHLTVSGLASSHKDEIFRAKQTIESVEREMKALIAYQQEESGGLANTNQSQPTAAQRALA